MPHTHTHVLWLAIIAVVVISIALVSGIELARSNSDIICSRSFTDQGACTDGSWGPWTTTGQNMDQNACQITYQESRVYTGLRNIITGSFSIRANLHSHCALSDDAFLGGTGDVISQYSACQIQESRTRVVSGTGSGPSCQVSNSTSTTIGTITSDTNTETDGAIDESKTETISGTYQLYLDMVDARLATSSIRVAPALLHSGEKTHVIWASDHVKVCTVSGTNGDAWPLPVTTTEIVTDDEGNQQEQQVTKMPAGKSGDELSSEIEQPTTYTLTCTTAIGTKQISHATVNLIPIFQEQ